MSNLLEIEDARTVAPRAAHTASLLHYRRPDLPYDPVVPGSFDSPSYNVLSHSDLVWREFLERYGVAGAVFSLTPTSAPTALRGQSSPRAERSAYLFGFDDARRDEQMLSAVLAYAERIWDNAAYAKGGMFRLSETAFPAQPTDIERSLAERFDQVMVSAATANGTGLRALLFWPADHEPVCRDVRDHICRAMPLFEQSASAKAAVAERQRQTSMLEAALNRVSFAMLLVNAGGRPLFMNNVAKKLLADHSGLRCLPDGAITCQNQAQAKELRATILRAATMNGAADEDWVLRLDDADGNWRLAHIVPAVSRSGDTAIRCAMIILLSPQPAHASASTLGALGLLPSEQRFLSKFLQSNSLSDAASEAGLSEETARTYLKRVRAKLGVHRQMELAGMISGLIPPLLVKHDEAEIGEQP